MTYSEIVLRLKIYDPALPKISKGLQTGRTKELEEPPAPLCSLVPLRPLVTSFSLLHNVSYATAPIHFYCAPVSGCRVYLRYVKPPYAGAQKASVVQSVRRLRAGTFKASYQRTSASTLHNRRFRCNSVASLLMDCQPDVTS